MITLDRFRQTRSRFRQEGLFRWVGILSPSTTWQPAAFLLLAIAVGFLLVRLPILWSTLLLVGVAILLLTLLQPLVGLGLTLLLGPLGALENVLFGSILLDSGQMSLLLTLAAWIAGVLLHRRMQLPTMSLGRPLLLFMYVASLSLLGAADITAGARELIKWVEIGLIMLMVFDLAVPTTGTPIHFGLSIKTWQVIGLLLLAGLSQALVGIWQFGLRGTGPEHFLVLGRFYRAYGTFEQPNPFGGFVNLTAMLAIGVLIGLVSWWLGSDQSMEEDGARPSDSRAPRTIRHLFWTTPAFYFMLLFVTICAAAASMALIFSWSRGAWLGFAAGIMAIVLFWSKSRRRGLVWLVVITAVAGGMLVAGTSLHLVPASVVDRLSSFSQDLQFGDVRGVDINDQNYAVLERLAHWQAALNMARDDPWLGVGFGNYEAAYGGYALLNWPDALGHAHNYYLNLLAETGVLGLASYLWLWVVLYRETVRIMARLSWPGRGIPLGLLGAWTALSVHHLVDKLYVNNNYIFLGVMIALLPMLSHVESWPQLSAVKAID